MLSVVTAEEDNVIERSGKRQPERALGQPPSSQGDGAHAQGGGPGSDL